MSTYTDRIYIIVINTFNTTIHSRKQPWCRGARFIYWNGLSEHKLPGRRDAHARPFHAPLGNHCQEDEPEMHRTSSPLLFSISPTSSSTATLQHGGLYKSTYMLRVKHCASLGCSPLPTMKDISEMCTWCRARSQQPPPPSAPHPLLQPPRSTAQAVAAHVTGPASCRPGSQWRAPRGPQIPPARKPWPIQARRGARERR
ncbi:hypothetical protein NDU88_008004 [Pleurodeles waltl]|uniref:Uncharacterized protein n=1 Tax=Pleurodeles waltl TaxID=8319 RepID=A0AAV7VSE1_PLEWA|nr:hypothetical protein NDU88_008004 [Pleurodeles waltl]